MDVRIYEPKEGGKTKNDHFRELLHLAKEKGVKPEAAIADSWYSSLGNLKETLLKSLILIMRTSDDIELNLWGKTLIRYKEKILNYFVYRTTDAYTEGLHVRCKLVQRLSYGFRNAEVYIRKVLLVLLPLSTVVTNSCYLSNRPLFLS